MKRLASALIILLMLPVAIMAQDNRKHETVKVYFRLGSKNIDPNYMNNAEALKQLASLLEPYVLDSTRGKGRIHIMASASPEGSNHTNNTLIEARSKAIADWIGKSFQVEVGHEVDLMGIDWDGLVSMVEASTEVPSKADVLDILRNTPETGYERQLQLEKLHNGTPYQWISQRLYPQMRYAAVRAQIWYASEITLISPSPVYYKAEGGNGSITFRKNVEDKVVPTVTCNEGWITDIVATGQDIAYKVSPNTATEPRSGIIRIECYGKDYQVEVHQEAAKPEPVVTEPEPVVEPMVKEEPKKPLYMAIKTNGLYDLALIPNIALEVYLGKNWSLSGNWMYAWWKSDRKHDYWRTYGGELELRKWFGKKADAKPLTGHHVGVYLQGLTYDFELGGTGYLSNFSYGAGVSYGYSMPIARRLNLDFVIGVGYLGGEYKEYEPIDGHYVWQATKDRKWFGPTKAEVSLVWLIGRGNDNVRKGGKK